MSECQPEQVAAPVRCIVSAPTFATGSDFVVDGGATAGMAMTAPERRAS